MCQKAESNLRHIEHSPREFEVAWGRDNSKNDHHQKAILYIQDQSFMPVMMTILAQDSRTIDSFCANAMYIVDDADGNTLRS